MTQEVTAAAGLPAYEISNHARPGAESRHNLVYWRSGEWAGIGPGAHARVEMNDGRHAFATERQPELWAARVEQTGNGVVSDELLDATEVADEYLLMGLRLREGISVTRFEELAGYRIDPQRIRDLEAHGLRWAQAPVVVAQDAQDDGSIVHSVRPGDTIDSIAVAYGVTRQDIMALNNISDPRIIQIGQELVVKEAGGGGSSRSSRNSGDDDDEDAPDGEGGEDGESGSCAGRFRRQRQGAAGA